MHTINHLNLINNQYKNLDKHQKSLFYLSSLYKQIGKQKRNNSDDEKKTYK